MPRIAEPRPIEIPMPAAAAEIRGKVNAKWQGQAMKATTPAVFVFESINTQEETLRYQLYAYPYSLSWEAKWTFMLPDSNRLLGRFLLLSAIVTAVAIAWVVLSEDDVGELAPSFEVVDSDGVTHSDESMRGEAYAMVLSASYCSSCDGTVAAFDESIPAGRLLIVSVYDGDSPKDIADWQKRIEDDLGREVNRPFIHSPEL